MPSFIRSSRSTPPALSATPFDRRRPRRGIGPPPAVGHRQHVLELDHSGLAVDRPLGELHAAITVAWIAAVLGRARGLHADLFGLEPCRGLLERQSGAEL